MRPAASASSCETPAQLSIEFLECLLRGYMARNFRVRLWDGSVWGQQQQSRFTLTLKHPGALRAMFLAPSELTLGEAYMYDDFDIEGDIEAALDLGDYLLGQDRSLRERLRMAELLRRLPASGRPRVGRQPANLRGSVHSGDRDRQAISYHYDLPADFYALWLDHGMTYSCAYFSNAEEDLDTAQERKLDYVCTKLRLRRGDRLLDIGCGWGGLVIHAAAHYGADAVGITLSVPQALVARQRIRDERLNDKCRVAVWDYREFEPGQQYDKIASIGMFEHVGAALLPEYFSRAWDLLRAGGVFLNHGIASSAKYRKRSPSFSDRYVFPDGELVPISTTLRAAELRGFEVRDVESLREHYALTLRHWVRGLETRADQARSISDDATYRTWRLYMAGAARGFRSGRLNVYQTLLAKPLHGETGLPLTREDWYPHRKARSPGQDGPTSA